MGVELVPSGVAMPPTKSRDALDRLLVEGVVHGDAEAWLPCLPRGVVDLFFTSPPYADARAYSRIHPDRYVEWFLPFARLCTTQLPRRVR